MNVINAANATQVIGPTNDPVTGAIIKALITTPIALLVELRVANNLAMFGPTGVSLDQMRADELNNVVPPGEF